MYNVCKQCRKKEKKMGKATNLLREQSAIY